MASKVYAVIASDFHCPFHDPAAVDALLRHVRRVKPARLIFAGDLMDNYKISRFHRDPKSQGLFWEIGQCNELLDHIQSRVPEETKIIWEDGNHEWRLEKFIWVRAPEFDGLITVKKQLDLPGRGIRYIPYGRAFEGKSNVVVFHGQRLSNISAGYSVRQDIEKEGCSVVRGHSHRLALIYRTLRGKTVFGVECGHMSDPEKAEYLRDRGLANWQQGFAELVEAPWGLEPRIYRVDKGRILDS